MQKLFILSRFLNLPPASFKRCSSPIKISLQAWPPLALWYQYPMHCRRWILLYPHILSVHHTGERLHTLRYLKERISLRYRVPSCSMLRKVRFFPGSNRLILIVCISNLGQRIERYRLRQHLLTPFTNCSLHKAFSSQGYHVRDLAGHPEKLLSLHLGLASQTRRYRGRFHHQGQSLGSSRVRSSPGSGAW